MIRDYQDEDSDAEGVGDESKLRVLDHSIRRWSNGSLDFRCASFQNPDETKTCVCVLF